MGSCNSTCHSPTLFPTWGHIYVTVLHIGLYLGVIVLDKCINLYYRDKIFYELSLTHLTSPRTATYLILLLTMIYSISQWAATYLMLLHRVTYLMLLSADIYLMLLFATAARLSDFFVFVLDVYLCTHSQCSLHVVCKGLTLSHRVQHTTIAADVVRKRLFTMSRKIIIHEHAASKNCCWRWWCLQDYYLRTCRFRLLSLAIAWLNDHYLWCQTIITYLMVSTIRH